MLKVFLIGHNYEYEVRELLKLFYDNNDIQVYCSQSDVNMKVKNLNEDIIINKLVRNKDEVIIVTEGDIEGEKNEITINSFLESNSFVARKKIKRLIKSTIFQLLTHNKKVNHPWGFLTGIRPTKIVHELINQGKTEEEIADVLGKDYFISEDKITLLLEVAKTEHRYVYPTNKNVVSIYLGIPFCPTRCSYCSFPANPLDKFQSYIDDYVEALCKEIKSTSEALERKAKKIETIYIGGGTPTTLNTKQLTKIINCIYKYFSLSKLSEFTVEAGRPDTIDAEKLLLFKESGVTRISINPQTMNDDTLKIIGRNHSVAEIIEAYELAKKIGFDNINMDIIIGLPGENTSMVRNTMEHIKRLSPSSLTVHTLAIKNASRLKEEHYSIKQDNRIISKMLEISERYGRAMGLSPYYLYRQKHMVGNFENIGYAKPGYECIYNIQMMEEKQTIIAMGAGAVSKIVFLKENRLERVPNVKNLEEYIKRTDEMVERKIRLLL